MARADTRLPVSARSLHPVVANGDKVWRTYDAPGMVGPPGGDFVGGVLVQGGTGRFDGAYGEASLDTHDEPDGSGWSRGSGWIVIRDGSEGVASVESPDYMMTLEGSWTGPECAWKNGTGDSYPMVMGIRQGELWAIA